MYNSNIPSRDQLPSTRQLLRSTFIAIATAIVLLVTTVLPGEYGIDPTGIGRLLGLTEMGEIKEQLSREAEEDRLKESQPVPAPAGDKRSGLIGTVLAELFLAKPAAASVQLARERGAGGGVLPCPLPGVLEVAEAGALERAVLVHGARHSHLVCLSPWSLAPPELGRDGLGLLPALACSDSIAWRRPAAECPPGFYCESLRFAWAVATRN